MVGFRHELRFEGLVAGVDEAGRGPLAGPVVAAAVIVPAKRVPSLLRGLVDDSKALSPAQRAAALIRMRAALIAGDIIVGIGAASVREIDKLNILQATFLAMRRALVRLSTPPAIALIDGNRVPPNAVVTCEPLIGGDAKSFSIAAASILAKETRDRAMRALGERHPAYDWQSNMGYGTSAHRQAIESSGPTRHHRLSFAPLRRYQFRI
jgi:ribonuclease HII